MLAEYSNTVLKHPGFTDTEMSVCHYAICETVVLVIAYQHWSTLFAESDNCGQNQKSIKLSETPAWYLVVDRIAKNNFMNLIFYFSF